MKGEYFSNADMGVLLFCFFGVGFCFADRDFLTASEPTRASPASQPSKGKAKSGSCRAAREQTFFARTQKLSPLCTTSLLFVSPGLPVLRGVSGGVSRSRRSPLSGLSFSLFFFLRERKRGYWRRSREISVTKAKPDNLSNNNVQSLPHRRKANCKKR